MELEWYVSNRDVIKNLAINTGTTADPVFTKICTTSEVGINTDLESKEWYVYCDALRRKLITGVSANLSGTVKLDVNNTGIQQLIGTIHTLLAEGEVAQFNNLLVEFELLKGVNNNVLEYEKYQCQVSLSLSDLGGAAEDEAEFSFEMVIMGKATVVQP